MANIHATAVAIDGKAVLLRGEPGSGKSDLALRLIDRGATLVADDQLDIEHESGVLYLSAPKSIKNLLEIRGLGIVHFDNIDHIPLALVIDLLVGKKEDRLPLPGFAEIEGLKIPQLKLEARFFHPARFDTNQANQPHR